ncbi:ubiquinone biosynthesis protein COQ4 [Lusitaniella coriacea]|nr:ubiquinone biosynthesis protein COQ4 [Lusitaniella coriacea]
MTLQEAIQELRALEAQKNDISAQMSDEMRKIFESHDAVHVLFACGTTIEDEIAAHVWMVFGTTAKLSEMHHAVANREHRTVLSGIGHFKLLNIWIGCLPRIFTILAKCLRMKKRFPLEELSRLKELSLCDLRYEYGIVV